MAELFVDGRRIQPGIHQVADGRGGGGRLEIDAGTGEREGAAADGTGPGGGTGGVGGRQPGEVGLDDRGDVGAELLDERGAQPALAGFGLMAVGAVLASASAITADYFGASRLPLRVRKS